jgi:hypothetical protein
MFFLGRNATRKKNFLTRFASRSSVAAKNELLRERLWGVSNSFANLENAIAFPIKTAPLKYVQKITRDLGTAKTSTSKHKKT